MAFVRHITWVQFRFWEWLVAAADYTVACQHSTVHYNLAVCALQDFVLGNLLKLNTGYVDGWRVCDWVNVCGNCS